MVTFSSGLVMLVLLSERVTFSVGSVILIVSLRVRLVSFIRKVVLVVVSLRVWLIVRFSCSVGSGFGRVMLGFWVWLEVFCSSSVVAFSGWIMFIVSLRGGVMLIWRPVMDGVGSGVVVLEVVLLGRACPA